VFRIHQLYNGEHDRDNEHGTHEQPGERRAQV
jgi:hypothetical protein